MNGRIVWRVMWKEYRALRGLWIAVALASWMAQLGVFMLSRELSWWEVAWGAALVTPVFYALGAAAATFAGEREEGADRFLLALPVSTAPLVTGKMLFLLLSTVAIVPAVALTTAAAPWWPESQLHDEDLLVVWAPAVLEVVAWGLLFSLLGRSVMQAAGLGAVAAAIGATVALWISNDQVDQVDSAQYGNALLTRLVIVGVVLLADLAVAREWLQGALGERDSSWRTWTGGLRAAWPRLSAWAARPLRWQGRMIWQSARQAVAGYSLAIALPIAFAFAIPSDLTPRFSSWDSSGKTETNTLWESVLILLAMFVGCRVFAADQRQRSYRCMAEQAVSASSLWWNRQFVGWAALLAGIIVWHLVWWLCLFARLGPISLFVPTETDKYAGSWSGITPREWALVALAYGVGQALSLFFRSNLVASLVAVMAIVPVFFWYQVTTLFALPAIGVLWPLVVGLLAATAVFLPRWLVDDRRPRTWLRAGGAFGLFAGGVLAVVPELRLADVPDEPIAFDVAAFRATLDIDARATAKLYSDALKAMRPLDPESELAEQHLRRERADAARIALLARLASGQINDADRDWLATNSEALQLTLAANERPTCAFVDWSGDFATRTRADLLTLLLLRGVADENKNDAVLASVGDALRMIGHMRPEPWTAERLERQTLEFIVASSAWPGQTVERLKAMDELLIGYEASVPNPDEWTKFEYLELLDHLNRAAAQYPSRLEAWFVGAPWERERAERLLRIGTNETLAAIDRTVQALQNGASLEWLNDAQSSPQFDRRFAVTPVFRYAAGAGWSTVPVLSVRAAERAARRRATRIMLELAVFRLRHDRFPDSLEQLSADLGRELPKDPYTGIAFRYFPQGFPIRVQLDVGLGREKALTMEDGQALLWSPGLQVRMTETQETGALTPGYSMRNGNQRFERVDDLRAWMSGWTFPIPR